MELFIVPLFPVSVSIAAFSSVQFSSVTQSCPTLCDPMNRSMPGLPVHHQLPEFTQTQAHRVSDAIQPSHPLSSTYSPAPNPSQHQSLPRVNSSHEVAKVLEFQRLLIALVMFYSQYCSFSQKMGSLLLIIISMSMELKDMELKDLGLSSLFRYCCINQVSSFIKLAWQYFLGGAIVSIQGNLSC